MQPKPTTEDLLRNLRTTLADPNLTKNYYRKLRFDKKKSLLRCRPVVEDVVFGPVVDDLYTGSPVYDYLHSIIGEKKNFELLTEVLALLLSLAKLEKGVPVAWLSTAWLKTCWEYEKHVEQRKVGINDRAARRCLEVLRVSGLIRVHKPGKTWETCTHYTFSSALLRQLEQDFKWVGLDYEVANDNQRAFNGEPNRDSILEVSYED